MSSVSIQAVSRIFEGHKGQRTPALLPVDFEVRDNDFVTILGPSGCGKSTLLRIVAGLDHATSGRVLLDGVPVEGPGADRGMVFQSYTLFPWLTIEQNIRFGLRERGMPEAQQKERAAYFIAKVGLRGFEQHFPKQLSGGMQQRTAIARALANDPKILLMDEPFGALDNQTRVLMQELLLGIWEAERKTVLFVTHDIDEAIFMANRVAVFSARPGRIKTELAVDLPHPRHYTIKTSPEFMDLKARLTEVTASRDRAASEHQEGVAQVEAALAAQFRPEFLNRIDELIRFHPLQIDDLVRIVRLQLADLASLLAEQGLALHVEDAVAQFIARQGFEPEYGARPLRRVLRRQLENPLATQLLEDRFRGVQGVRVDLADGEAGPLTFSPWGEEVHPVR